MDNEQTQDWSQSARWFKWKCEHSRKSTYSSVADRFPICRRVSRKEGDLVALNRPKQIFNLFHRFCIAMLAEQEMIWWSDRRFT